MILLKMGKLFIVLCGAILLLIVLLLVITFIIGGGMVEMVMEIIGNKFVS